MLAKTETFNQRKVSLFAPPTDGSLKVLFYHPQTVNAFLLSNSFPLPSVWLSRRSPIHVGSLEGFVLSPSKGKRSTTFHIFSFADVCDCREVSFVWFFGFISIF